MRKENGWLDIDMEEPSPSLSFSPRAAVSENIKSDGKHCKRKDGKLVAKQ